MDEERLKALFEAYVNPSGGRTLEELLKSKDKLKGAEAQRLRGHFSSYCLHPADCQDPIFVADLMTGRLEALRQRWEDDIKQSQGSVEAARSKWENCSSAKSREPLLSSPRLTSIRTVSPPVRDSPNQLPIVDILQIGAWTQLSKVNYTALQHSLTCTPLLHHFKWSSLLLRACPNPIPISAINHRNRYGTTSMHEASMTLMRPGETEMRAKVLRWLLDHGANADVLDGDHCSPRSTGGKVPQFKQIINEFDQVQIKTEAMGKGGGGKEEVALKANLRCGRCRARNYCGAACQKMDWAAHKKQCVAVASNAPPAQTEIESKAGEVKTA
ncbi:BQ2448_2125 [Microbotryum intermedium]|uniref:BQ2448_2125 protein n=1 Tax=Microbotryum intermedium TaxID=269621 RepID=A0A238F7C8_9BASI|nr:BQ2448_2125 [Microbotryum intermedium]